MTKRIRLTDLTVSRIRVTESPLPRIDPQAVADALGAEPGGEPRVKKGVEPDWPVSLRL